MKYRVIRKPKSKSVKPFNSISNCLPGPFKDMWDNLSPDVKTEMIGLLFHDTMVSLVKIRECESPIEQIFALYFLKAANETGFADNAFLLFKPQKLISVTGGKVYRVDFMIQAQIYGKWVSLIVECDGHDYHERTKEQAAADKQRDRLLKAAGYEVIRFTGSEICKNPYNCALETVEFMQSIARKEVKCANQ